MKVNSNSYIINVSWQLSERIISLIIGFIVSIVLARLYGPESYGQYTYIIAIASIIGVIGHGGIQGIAIRELTLSESSNDSVFGTLLGIKVFLFSVAAIVFYLYVSTNNEDILGYGLYAVSIMILAKGFLIPEFALQSKNKNQQIAVSRLMSSFIGNSAKILIAITGLSVINLFYANMLQVFVLVISFWIFMKIINYDYNMSFSWELALQYLKKGSLVFIGTVFSLIYLKIDQVMLKEIIGYKEVGYYSVAVQISESWYFLPAIITTVIFPKLIKDGDKSEKVFYSSIGLLTEVLLVISILGALIISYISAPIIDFAFGKNYAASAIILSIHIWAGVFVFLRAVVSKWILIKEYYYFSVISQGLGAILNVGLNILLIPQHGGAGAAFATLLSYSSSLIFSLLIYKPARPLMLELLKSLLFIKLRRKIGNYEKFN